MHIVYDVLGVIGALKEGDAPASDRCSGLIVPGFELRARGLVVPWAIPAISRFPRVNVFKLSAFIPPSDDTLGRRKSRTLSTALAL